MSGAEEIAIENLDIKNTPNSEDEIDLSGDKGVMKKILTPGIGGDYPSIGCTVSVHYRGTLPSNGDWVQFDSSYDSNRPFQFKLGDEQVISAFDMGVASMKKNEKCVLTCAPKYAYGATGSPPKIPPNTTLTFEMELLDWEGEDLSPKGDKGITRFIITKGKNKKSPKDGALVKVSIQGSFKDRIFDDRENVAFNLIEDDEIEVIDGIVIALQRFTKGETSRLVITAPYAFGDKGNDQFDIPPKATVEYIVTLNDFENEVEPWKLDEKESINQAKLFKEKGTEYFKKQKYDLAIKMYNKSNEYLSSYVSTNGFDNNKPPSETTQEANQLKCAVFLNIALCHQKLDDDFAAKQACNTVLELDRNNIKALYRRGQSYIKLGEPSQALIDFNRIHELDNKNTAAITQVAICKKVIKEYNENQKKLYANMFSKFANDDNEKIELDQSNEDVLSACGEWSVEEQARMEADRVFEEVNRNVFMI